ncbi:MAG: excalibur calcium-binding domain-containing protein [Rhodobacteraceae bacterium]|nr:excalibur calcium-binding domain-containing protein [Paracoccaceae bacterium]
MAKSFLRIFFIILLADSTASAHSGGLNAAGCHAGSRPYHCHRSQSSAPVRSRTTGDKNCSDFSTWQQAQAFFIANQPGDRHGLDRDNDGIACESLR